MGLGATSTRPMPVLSPNPKLRSACMGLATRSLYEAVTPRITLCKLSVTAVQPLRGYSTTELSLQPVRIDQERKRVTGA